MRQRSLSNERGQILVIVAIGMVVLLGFLALAVDVGMNYQSRRNMQNAADAGALAGAQALCRGESVSDAIAAAEAARARNGGSGPTPEITEATGVVSVTAEITSDTFFAGAGVTKVDEMYAHASAKAQCGCSSGACGLWPIAFDEDIFRDAAGSCSSGPVHFLLWDDDGISCWDPAWEGDGIHDPEDYYDCEGMAAVPGEFRTWVDLSAALPSGETDPCNQTGCGTSELNERLIGEEKHTGEACLSYMRLPYCIPGSASVRNDSWVTAGEQVGRVVRVPLYSSMGCTMEDDPGNTCSNMRYYIESIGCIRVIASRYICTQAWQDNPKNETKTCKDIRVIEVELLCPGDPDYEECTTACGALTDPYDGCLMTVGLIE
ncbi:MAG: pilus assembly protein TadG-related protein [Anaerolineae bacterium]